ncbi:unnamed protein product [Linum tenue]|uniref:Uncharacterized protein n=1 Tax=Linum tenue TaxID=586396 RepID=A0AAV0LZQ3_9ROSI|nr:unnamed protein product [Linum tenue]
MVCCTGEGTCPSAENFPQGDQSALGKSCSSSTWEDGEPVQEEICSFEGGLSKQEKCSLSFQPLSYG